MAHLYLNAALFEAQFASVFLYYPYSHQQMLNKTFTHRSPYAKKQAIFLIK